MMTSVPSPPGAEGSPGGPADLSIGALSRMSGVPVETLRNWERRYGFPSPRRRSSGHRRYPLEQLERLLLIHAAVEEGLKPSFAVPATPAELRRVLAELDSPSLLRIVTPPVAADDGPARQRALLHEATLALDGELFSGHLFRAATRLGAEVFVFEVVLPFLRELGDSWAAGTISVAHEHFASECLEQFLAAKWRPLAEHARGPTVILACPEGEHHSLALHLGALFVGQADLRPLLLGQSTPLEDLVGAVRASHARAVILALAPSTDLDRATAYLARLVERLPPATRIIVGGNDRLPGVPGVSILKSLGELASFIREQLTG